MIRGIHLRCAATNICSYYYYYYVCTDPHKLGIRCRVNGKTMQDSNTDQLIFKTRALIEFISK